MLPEEDTGGKSLPQPEGTFLPVEDLANLKRAARDVTGYSYSPYSGFPVGAAVLASSGKIFQGTNIENASYGLAICAERSAIFCAVSAGESEITAVSIYTPTDEPQLPCGACLQVIAEFASGDIPLIMITEGNERVVKLSGLLPEIFKLKKKEK